MTTSGHAHIRSVTLEQVAKAVDDVTARVGAVHSLGGFEWLTIRNEIRRGVVSALTAATLSEDLE